MYSRHRFPGEIISYCVWWYYTFPLSYRDTEKMMLYRGIEVTYESIREWCQKFGQQYANQLQRKRRYITDKWHLDEMVVTIKKQQYYLWRAVDSEGNVLNVLLQRHRDTEAAKRFFRKLLKKQGFVPRVMVTDKLKSYEAAKKQVMPSVEHRQHKGLNNRAENSHQPTRVRERRMRRFKSPGQAQRFLSAFDPIRSHFHPKQHDLSSKRYREQMRQCFEDSWEITCVKDAA
ncbi:putative transposase (plasmid) [Leptolyngbya boryana NIES-2135]|jgi:putative transposase|uniref:Putative transposase n=1 Tax=Leptolyngbya boryana NIES-2135 TaxID=1973484 RepID=A0A1Z4JSH6_LEPBY|nr:MULTISPECIES: IS6 family transposase [Leptolyngbya]BAY59721.1 putative transposase [Leptolyngbya boryana NIES-2135]MBD2370625.1 IS6 family transposase [Leptolyngbya sp. FACHB-161]MBD2376992.1 IS6 family transposase [Leptolyngbya sp. FACHB-238]MBD2401359.1 IS6 family transposase [Leptolyngbya sp. FACHB-239]MBD2407910.1 IS6 family transposase [Leptolyngbya sp. FACHB-402]